MLIGVIADDFTGASDIANTLAKGVVPEGGLKTAQYPGIPSVHASSDVDAGVISLKSRSAPITEAVDQSLEALAWLQAQGCRQIIFKYCSTFDSTDKGNIGPVAEALAEALGVKGVVACPAFPAAGRTVYQGHLFVHDALLSESGMQHHPLTPMTDPDIRRVLASQCDASVGHIGYQDVVSGPQTISLALSEQASHHELLIVDAIQDLDLLNIAEALGFAPLVTGGSGIAMGLPRNFIRAGLAEASTTVDQGIDGPAAILAGSCSGATRTQINYHSNRYPVLPIDVPKVMAGEVRSETLVEFITSHSDALPLVYSSGQPVEVTQMQERYGRERVSEKLDTLFADTATTLLGRGYSKLIVAGGETSGAVAQAIAEQLGSPAMVIGREIDPGVPVLLLGANKQVALALKSGNFGTEDFFEKAAAIMDGRK
ncbi:MAG: 3-oxo-tetronate kinase [Roseibium sp.]